MKELRQDCIGQITVLADADGFCLCRRPGEWPFVRTRDQIDKLPYAEGGDPIRFATRPREVPIGNCVIDDRRANGPRT